MKKLEKTSIILVILTAWTVTLTSCGATSSSNQALESEPIPKPKPRPLIVEYCDTIQSPDVAWIHDTVRGCDYVVIDHSVFVWMGNDLIGASTSLRIQSQ